MTLDTAVVLAAIVLALLWPLHQQLCIRKLRLDIGQLSDGQQNHYQHITTLYQNLPHHPGPAHQPMNDKVWSGAMADVAKVTATISGDASLQAHTRYSPEVRPDPDPTLRLRRPPALSDIESLIATAGRCLTPTELADRLERRPWDLLPELERLTTAGRIKLVPGHTAGRSAYTLADPTVRLSRMPILPGVTP